MRRANGEMRGVNNTLETINAAATAIAAAENRVPQAAVQKRRWGSCWSLYWCFGSHKNKQRIRHAVLVPEPTAPRADAPATENPIQTPSVVLPFVAPPSSPASFLQSEPPSTTQSPGGVLSFSSMTAGMYSPGGPASIFAIGPYAHETQLVTPPAFSTYTTEPSTAPFTPPPESVHLTTPSSPEVPFARLLDPIQQRGGAGQTFPLSQYEFQSYLLHPGSPVSNLISPCSGISGSGTSSPFPDREFAPGNPHFLEFRTGDHSKLLNLEKMSREWGSHQGSGTLTPDAVAPRSHDGVLSDNQSYDVAPRYTPNNGWRNDEIVVDHRVSFEITAEEVVRCVEKKSEAFHKAASASHENAEKNTKREERRKYMENGHKSSAGEISTDGSDKASSDGEGGKSHQKQRSTTLGSAKEFNFDNVDGGNSDKSCTSSDWWANEKVLGKESPTSKDWSFFPMMQPGVS